MELIHKIKNSTLFRSAFNLMLSSGVISIFGFVFWIIIARNFTSHDVGIATTLISSALLISLLGQAGFDTTFIRFLPKAANKNAHINSGLAVSGIMSATIALVFCIASPVFSERLSFLSTSPSYAAMFVAFVVFATWNTLTNAVLIAYRKTVYVLVIDLLFSIVKVSLPFIFVNGGPMTIFMLVGIAQVINVLLSISVLMGKFQFKPKVQIDRSVLRETKKYSLGVYAANVLNLLPDSLLPIIIINKLGASDSAYFYIAFAIANLVYTIAFAITQVLLAETANDEKRFEQHARRGMLIAVSLLTPAIIAVVFVAPYLLELFGKTYAASGLETLRIMVGSGFFVLAYSFLGFYYKHTKRLVPNIIMTAVNAFSIVGLSIVLTPKHGLPGVGWAWFLGTAISVLAGGILFATGRGRRTNISTSPKHILITHVYSKNNKGDAALLSVLISDIRKKYSSATISIVVSDNIEYHKVFDGIGNIYESFMFVVNSGATSGLMLVIRSAYVCMATLAWSLVKRCTGYSLGVDKRLKPTLEAYGNSDLIIPVGGGYMRGQGNTPGSLLHTMMLLHPLIISRILRTPVILYSQSFGPFTSRLEESIVRMTLNKCTQCSIARESISYRLLHSMGVKHVERSIDCGFAFDTKKEGVDLRKMLNIPASRKIIGITAKKYLRGQQHDNYLLEVAGAIDHICKKNNVEVVFIPQVTARELNADDRIVHEDIYQLVRDKAHVHQLTEDFDHHKIKAIYSSLDYMIGTRFHSVIFALTSYVPSIAIEYEHKTSGIMNDLKLNKWVIKIEEVTSERITQLFSELVKDNNRYEEHLKRTIPKYKQRAAEAIEIVDKYYRAL